MTNEIAKNKTEEVVTVLNAIRLLAQSLNQNISLTQQIRVAFDEIVALQNEGVPPEKIRVVFNRVVFDRIGMTDADKLKVIQKQFPSLFLFHEVEGLFTINQKAYIQESDLFIRLGKQGTIHDVIASSSPADIRQQIAASKDADERLDLSRQLGTRQAAEGMKKMLDTCFAEVFA